ncbi:MAG: MJ0042-type zinc finger domain-containing protein [Novosphingobium meiothermophilum]
MIIACPACSTRYVVPDSAIGVDGRTVRCAKCRHSWFQHGPEMPEAAVAAAAEPAPAAPAESTATAQQAPEPASVSPPEAATEPPMPPARPEPAAQARYRTAANAVPDLPHSPFEHEPPFRPRRNPAKMWTIGAVAFALTVTGLSAAVYTYGVPQWLPGTGQTFGADRPDLKLSFPAEKQDRRKLPNGTEYFGASGTVTNTGKQVRALPQILIVLRDSRDKVVKTWEVPPPQDELAPGESVTINAAVTDVPRSAKFAEIGWKPD